MSLLQIRLIYLLLLLLISFMLLFLYLHLFLLCIALPNWASWSSAHEALAILHFLQEQSEFVELMAEQAGQQETQERCLAVPVEQAQQQSGASNNCART